MKTIEISNETYAMLQKLAEPFEDSPEDVILSLFETVRGKNGTADEEPRPKSQRSSGGADLVSQGGRIPHGTKLRAVYKGQEYLAEVRNGRVYWNGSGYTSLSGAAVAVIQSTGTDRPTEDGWRFWEFWDEETGKWASKADPSERSW